MNEDKMLSKLIPLKEALKITNEDIELLKEMKKNCLKSNVYEDDKRLLKANAISKFLICYEENLQLKEKVEFWHKNYQDVIKCNVEFNNENQQLKDYKNKWEALKLAIIGNFNKTQNTIYLDILANIIEPIERADNNDK